MQPKLARVRLCHAQKGMSNKQAENAWKILLTRIARIAAATSSNLTNCSARSKKLERVTRIVELRSD
jgi:hypothetical protein